MKKKIILFLSGVIIALGFISLSAQDVLADNASDEYYENALKQVATANNEYELQKAVVDSAKKAYEEVKASPDQLAKQKAYDYMVNSENRLRAKLDVLNNAKANLSAAEGRKQLAAKNENEIINNQSAVMKDAVGAIESYKKQLKESPSLQAPIDKLSDTLARQQAEAMALLSMKYEYEDPHDEYVNFSYDPGITVSMLNPTVLNAKDSVIYAKWKMEDKDSLTDAEIDEINTFVNDICDGYIDYREGISRGAYYDAIYKSVDDQYKAYYLRWIKYKLGNNAVEKKVLNMFLDIYYERVDAMYKHLVNKELSEDEKLNVLMMEEYERDLASDKHAESFLEKSLTASLSQGVDRVINEFDEGIDLDEQLKEMTAILMDKK